MKYYSTNKQSPKVSFKEALFQGLAPDGGLYMPEILPNLDIKELEGLNMNAIAVNIAKHFVEPDISEENLKGLINNAINFPAPLTEINESTSIMELYHGPSLAFKDFGARFMAHAMGILNNNDKKLTILVATSGDTGGAVAHGFYKVPGIEVVILYPSGQVSDIQEKQLTTLGHNVKTLEVKGTFDDCQAMVKSAFMDEELKSSMRLASANSINIGRLIPQSFYFFNTAIKLHKKGKSIVFSIPSGNFGNLTACLFAKKMGAPIHKIIASVNNNSVFPEFMESGEFKPRPSVHTISNAMDIGNPSNFWRLNDIFKGDINNFKKDIWSCSSTDEETKIAMKEVYKSSKQVIDPHGAVAYLGLQKYRKEFGEDNYGVILQTAHAAKFKKVVESAIGTDVEIPKRLAECLNKEKDAEIIGNTPEDLKEYLMK